MLLVGVLADKDYESLFSILAPEADEFVCVTPENARALAAEQLAEYLRRFGKPVTACAGIPEGVSAALDAAADGGMACAVGSLYMAGAVRACFNLF